MTCVALPMARPAARATVHAISHHKLGPALAWPSEREAGTVLHNTGGIPPIAPIHPVDRQHGEAVGAASQDRLREIDRPKHRIGRLHRLALARRPEGLSDRLEDTHQSRRQLRKEIEQHRGARDEYHGVPEAPFEIQVGGLVEARLLPEAAHPVDRLALHLREDLPRLNPAVVDLRPARVDAKHDGVCGAPVGVNCGAGDGRHEPGLLPDEMVSGQEHDHSLRVPQVDVQERQQDARAGLAIAGLDDYGFRRAVVELLAGIGQMPLGDDGEEAPGRDEPFSARQRVAQHRAVIEEGTILLGALGAKAGTDEGLQPPPIAASQHNAPEMYLCGLPG
jgi:hypothetical protein